MKAVLDTNAWLDWLVFADARCGTLVAGWRAGRIRIVHTAAMRAEWVDVIGRSCFALDEDARGALGRTYDRISSLRPASPACAMACHDPDDQKFIDLAVAERARWLVTRDKALLALARRALREHALRIVRPEDDALRDALHAAPRPAPRCRSGGATSL